MLVILDFSTTSFRGSSHPDFVIFVTVACVGVRRLRAILFVCRLFVGTGVARSKDAVFAIHFLSMVMTCLLPSMKVKGSVVRDISLFYSSDVFLSFATKVSGGW